MIWLDVLTPKQALLFSSFKRKLEKKGFKVLVTARKHDSTVSLLEMNKVSPVVIGEHGGGSRTGKLIASAERTLNLACFIGELKEKPLWAVHLSSPEAARVAFGLQIKNICLNDTPHSFFVAKLTFPLADYLVAPSCIDKKKLVELGAPEKGIAQYEGVDEVEWLRSFKPNKNVIHELGLDMDRLLIVFRPEESQASYLIGTMDQALTIKFLEVIVKEHGDAQIVVLPRYKDQKTLLRRRFREGIIIPGEAIDAPSLMAFSDLVVTGGGTMGREAALMGTPAVSYFPFHLDVDNYLKSKGFPIWQISKLGEAVKKSLEILKNPEKHKVETSSLLRQLQAPSDIIIPLIIEKTST